MTNEFSKSHAFESGKRAGRGRALDATGLSIWLVRMLCERLNGAQGALAPVLADSTGQDPARPLLRKANKGIGEALEIAQMVEDLLNDPVDMASESTQWRPLVLSCLERLQSGPRGEGLHVSQVQGDDCAVAGPERVIRRVALGVLEGLSDPSAAPCPGPIRLWWRVETPTPEDLATLLVFGPLHPGPCVRLSIVGPASPGAALLAVAQGPSEGQPSPRPDLAALMTLAALRALHGGLRQTRVDDTSSALEIYLPVAAKTIGAQPVDMAVRWEVLVLDGNDLVAETTRRMLERGGYRAFSTCQMDQTFALLDDPERLIGCLIMDARYVDPYLEWLLDTSRPKTPPLAVILTGDYLEAIPAKRLGQLACRGFLRKPFNREALLGTVQNVLLRGVS